MRNLHSIIGDSIAVNIAYSGGRRQMAKVTQDSEYATWGMKLNLDAPVIINPLTVGN